LAVFTGSTPVQGNQAGINVCLITQLGLVSTHLILRRQDNPIELFLTSMSHETATAVHTKRRMIFQRKRMLNKLNDLLDNNLKGKIIAVLGLAFKQETDDVRESPAIEIITGIHDKGGIIKAYDPIANDSMREIFPALDFKSNWYEAVEGSDAAVIMTEWNEFRSMDLEKLKILMSQPVVLDTRNILNVSELKRLEFKFDNVGHRVA